ncbi:MAG: hypothetical protein M1835_007749 [Candelina submexicana]|nr:MAG: hypothetical protein M1835_007749 [Candelina submexicana]
MPSSNLDHNYYTLNNPQHRPSQLGYEGDSLEFAQASHNSTTYPAPGDPSFSTTGHVSRSPRSSPPLPTVPANNSVYTPNAHLNGFVRTNTSPNETKVDPHDFYRAYQSSFLKAQSDFLGQSDIVVAGRENEMATAARQRKTNVSRPRNPTPKALSTTSRNVTSPTTRSASAPLGAVKSTLAHSGPTKSEQNSLKERVLQFNAVKDEMLPLPTNNLSRSTSVAASPIGGSLKNGRTQIPSLSKVPRGASSSKDVSLSQKRVIKTSNGPYRRGYSPETLTNAAKPAQSLHGKSSPLQVLGGPYTSQSLSNLHHTRSGPSRPPLFGEVLSITPGSPDLGYGIPGGRRRRGSEGSMHNPNPMFPPDRRRSDVELSPSSPTAWYLGVTPSLDRINIHKGRVPEARPGHRRARSDFAGAPSIPADASGLDLYSSQSPSQSYSHEPSYRGPPSRIPLSNRRPSITSDITTSPVSLRAPKNHLSSQNLTSKPMSKFSRGNRKPVSPVRQPTPTSPLSASLRQPVSPVRLRTPTSPRPNPRSRGRYEAGSELPNHNTQTLAFISSPLPAKSPTLRGSRHRQPVSSASTSASRAKISERYKGKDGSDSSGKDAESGSKKIVDIAQVDFKKRRDRIVEFIAQNTKSPLEEEQASTSKRATERKSKQPSSQQGMAATSRAVNNENQVLRPADKIPDEIETTQSDKDDAQSSGSSQRERHRERPLRIDTTNLPEGLDEDAITRGTEFDSDDSPTLGVPGIFPHIIPPTPQDEAPLADNISESPVDMDSPTIPLASDSSTDSISDAKRQRSVLSQILQMRVSSPPSPSRTEFAEDSTSEKDEKESIQIMLGATPVLDHPPEEEDGRLWQTEQRGNNRNDIGGDRWITNARGLSIRDRQNSPMERIAESTPPLPGSSTIPDTPQSMGHVQTPSWSPKLLSGPGTGRSTLDSDAYNTVNQVFDLYHSSRSPELAIKGGYNTKTVTQLYLREQRLHTRDNDQVVARRDLPKLEIVRPEAEPKSQTGTDSTAAGASISPVTDIEGESGDPTDELDDYEAFPSEGASKRSSHLIIQGGLEVVEPEPNLNRASLDSRDDWFFTSPSIADWIPHQAADTPIAEKPSPDYRPTPPPKDWRASRSPPVPAKLPLHARRDLPDGDGLDTPRVSTDSRPRLPELESAGEGLGLGLLPQPPDACVSEQSPTLPPPPLPNHSPPPPPDLDCVDGALGLQSQTQWSPTSPSVYSRNPPSSTFPAAFYDGGEPRPRSQFSIDSSNQQGISTPSIPPSGSSHSPEHASQDRDTPGGVSSPSRLKQRRYVIEELVTTEKSFYSDMKVLEEIYRPTSGGALKPEDAKVIFGNVDQIVAFADEFLARLKQAAVSVFVLPKTKFDGSRSQRGSISTSNSGHADHQSEASQTDLTDDQKDRKTFIGEVFCEHLKLMEKVYREWVKGQDASYDRVKAIQDEPVVKEWLESCKINSDDLTKAWNLDSLLSKPFQRITKYRLILDNLKKATPEDHPDYFAISSAFTEMGAMLSRINDSQRRRELVQNVVVKKRKDSGFTKVIGRRAEKLRLQAGLTDTVEDQEFKSIAGAFHEHLARLHVVRTDVVNYTAQVQEYVDRFIEYTKALEAYIDVGQSNHPEIESKWRKFAMTIREIATIALVDHLGSVHRSVIDPMSALLKQHENPQVIMNKRNKRLVDFARCKAAIDRGEKPDRKTKEQYEQFVLLNDSLKEELPQLFALTAKLVEACLGSFVQIQKQWQYIWQQKVKSVLEQNQIPKRPSQIIDQFGPDFALTQAQVLSLGICNGSLLNDAINLVGFLSPATTFSGDDSSSLKRPATTSSTRTRAISVTTDVSPVLPHPDFGQRHSGNFTFSPLVESITGPYHPPQPSSHGRIRASSAVSGRGPSTPDVSTNRSYSANYTPTSSIPGSRPGTNAGRSTEPSPAMPRYSVDSAQDPRPGSGSYSSNRQDIRQRSPSPERFSTGIFSSAVPMSDSPVESRSFTPRGSSEQRRDPSTGYNVLFSVGSMHNFNIDRLMRQAGYPYLTYVKGEIFDVLGENGELWLAKNQDDSSNTIGWIWNKHFGRLD